MAITPMSPESEAEFTAFCRKDGLSPSGTHYQLWKDARPLGLLPAIWAVHNSEVPSGDTLLRLQALEPYAQSPLEPEYLTSQEAADTLGVTSAWIRTLMNRGLLPFKDTPLGRLIDKRDVDAYDEARDEKREEGGAGRV